MATHLMTVSNFNFTLGNIGNVTAYELNFWVLPYYDGNGTGQIDFMKISNDIVIGFNYDGTIAKFSLTYNGNTVQYGTVPVSGTNWINMNLRVSYGNYI